MPKLRKFFYVLRIIIAWTIVSLLMQGGFYYALNSRVETVLFPTIDIVEPIIDTVTATIYGTELENVQLSYDKTYVAYIERGTFKVFNITQEKQVYQNIPPASTDPVMGIHSYQWLPDRNTLLYFHTKRNPNEVWQERIDPTPQVVMVPSDPEDPNSEPVYETIIGEPTFVTRYGNPHMVELYTLEFPESDDTESLPDDRFNQSITQLPRNGIITDLVFSTASNLIYLNAKGNTQLLLEIDVMKRIYVRSRSGETVGRMASSERFGTLYYDSTIGNASEVIALSSNRRWVISRNPTNQVLGVKDGKVFLGVVINDQLVRVMTASDRLDLAESPAMRTEWEGSVPFKDNRVLISAKGEVIVYNHSLAYLIVNGRERVIPFGGDENYISMDGSVRMQFTKDNGFTLLELHPL